jgi:hypothetical protein
VSEGVAAGVVPGLTNAGNRLQEKSAVSGHRRPRHSMKIEVA